jgi:hypothetical protein
MHEPARAATMQLASHFHLDLPLQPTTPQKKLNLQTLLTARHYPIIIESTIRSLTPDTLKQQQN